LPCPIVSRFLMCSTCLQEAEEKLAALQHSLDGDPAQRFKISEALSFARQTRTSKTRPRCGSLDRPRSSAIFREPGEIVRPLSCEVFCTGIHTFPQCSGEITLANFSRRSYYAHRLIEKKNFSTQFKKAAAGKTESASNELSWEEGFAI
jgi:hypothetical protein